MMRELGGGRGGDSMYYSFTRVATSTLHVDFQMGPYKDYTHDK